MNPPFQQPKAKSFAKNRRYYIVTDCSMTFPQFIKIGRFGCAHCYETFKEQLNPILKRLHSGNIGS